MTGGTTSDQYPVPIAQVGVCFNQPREFVAELQARGPNLEPLVRLTLVGRSRRLRGQLLSGQELWAHASYLRRTGNVVHLVTLECDVGAWHGVPELDAQTEQRADEVRELVRAAAGAAGLEVASGRYATPGGR